MDVDADVDVVAMSVVVVAVALAVVNVGVGGMGVAQRAGASRNTTRPVWAWWCPRLKSPIVVDAGGGCRLLDTPVLLLLGI